MNSVNKLCVYEAALQYAQYGLAVFPLNPNTKVPAVSGGYKSSSTDQERIEEWFDNKLGRNIGIATGAVSRLLVIDIDCKNDGVNGYDSLKILEEKFGPFATLEVLTPSGGMHLYFRYDDKGIRIGVNLLPGIDYRGNGGYVVAPPSVIDGEYYKWK